MINYSGDLLNKPPSGGDEKLIYGIEKDKELEEKYKIYKLNERNKT